MFLEELQLGKDEVATLATDETFMKEQSPVINPSVVDTSSKNIKSSEADEGKMKAIVTDKSKAVSVEE